MRAFLTSRRLFALALILWALASPRATLASPAFVVIVHSENPITTVDRRFLEDAFLKKVTRWPGDGSLHPVDLAASSAIRRKFSTEVLGRSVEEVRSYWQQRIFSGRDVPPVELDTEDEVVAYVAAHPGAVGYVSANADLKKTKSVTLQ